MIVKVSKIWIFDIFRLNQMIICTVKEIKTRKRVEIIHRIETIRTYNHETQTLHTGSYRKPRAWT